MSRFLGYFDDDGVYRIVELSDRAYEDVAYYRTNYIAFEFDTLYEAKNFLKQIENTTTRYFKNNLVATEIYVSDIHFPYQDELALSAFWTLARDIKAEIIYLGGDILDGYALSDWLKNGELADVIKEIDTTKMFLLQVRRTFPNATIYYHEGNHELRLQRTLLRSGDLLPIALRYANIQQLLSFGKFNIKYVKSAFPDPVFGLLYHLHGHEKKYTGAVQHVCLNLLRWLNKSLIVGHFHKFDLFYLPEVDRSVKGAWANGCLFDVNRMPTPYVLDISQRGFSIVKYYSNKTYSVEQVVFIPRIVKGRLKYSVSLGDVNYVF